MTKKIYGYIIGLFIVATSMISLNLATPASAAERYCDTNSIIRCGALTATELQQKYAANLGNVQGIFSHYGVSSAMVANAGSAKMGTVGKNGEVKVDGKVVATAAQSVGREHVPGSTAVNIGGTTVYQRATQSVFIDEVQTAFIFLDGEGQFLAAIITSCGNPVVATPTPKPPTPVAACTNLTLIRSTKENDEGTVAFQATASASNGATISSYVFTVRKDNAAGAAVKTVTVTSTSTTAKTADMTFEPGTYYASVTVKTSIGDKTAPACTLSFLVPTPEQTEVCNPETGETITVDKKDADKYKPVGDVACKDIKVCELESKDIITIKESEYDTNIHSKNLSDCEEKVLPATVEIPKTGPAELIGSGIALSSLTAAGYYWNASRRNLISKLLNR